MLDSGAVGTAAVPSGASTGEHEALELRDGDKKRYLGKGVLEGRRERDKLLGPVVIGLDAFDQAGLDHAMMDRRRHPQQGEGRRQRHPGRLDGGGARGGRGAGRAALQVPRWPGARVLPVPLMNIINGGAHADNSLDFQEFMIVPKGLPRFSEALRAGAEVFHTLKKILHDKKASTGVGDEGGFAPDLPGAEAALRDRRRGDREGRLQAGQGRGAGAGRRLQRAVGQDQQDLQAGGREERARRQRDGRVLQEALRAVPDRVD